MNIFFLSRAAAAAAKAQCDRHVVKMTLETTQMLFTAHHLLESPALATAPRVYKATHKGHPSVVWAAESTAHYSWLAAHGLALAHEYTLRYDGKKHACEPLLEWLRDHAPPCPATTWLRPPPQAMPPEHQRGMPPPADAGTDVGVMEGEAAVAAVVQSAFMSTSAAGAGSVATGAVGVVVGVVDTAQVAGASGPSDADTVAAYRAYYAEVKARKPWFAYARGRSMPKWLTAAIGSVDDGGE